MPPWCRVVGSVPPSPTTGRSLFLERRPRAHEGSHEDTMAATYEAKNVLITGGAGFIASHVAILFAKKYPNYKVRGRRFEGPLCLMPVRGRPWGR